MKLYINSLFVGLVTFLWASLYGFHSYWNAENLLSLQMEKPWVYRQLVPVPARFLVSMGVSSEMSIILIVTLSGLGFYLALRSLYFTLYAHSDKAEIYLLCVVFFGMTLFGQYRQTYDLMTVFLFTLSLLLILQGRNVLYLLVFTLSCLNRETSFLLVIFYMAISFLGNLGNRPSQIKSQMWMCLIQIYIYTLIFVCLRIAFQYNPGQTLWVEPARNLKMFMDYPWMTILHLAGGAGILWVMSRDWEYKADYLKVYFWVIAPLLIVMYIVSGQAYEIRVFWELFPAMGLLSIPKAKL